MLNPQRNLKLNFQAIAKKFLITKKTLSISLNAFIEHSNLSPHKIEIYIDKNIPVAAGLAGGSTDAAGTLFGLNELFGTPLSKKELHTLCAKLGSDLNSVLKAEGR